MCTDLFFASLKHVFNGCMQEVQDGKIQMTDLTNQWYQAIRAPIDESENEDSEINSV